MNPIPLVTMTDHIRLGLPWIRIEDEMRHPLDPAKSPEPIYWRDPYDEIVSIRAIVEHNSRLLLAIQERISTPWYTRLMNWARSFFR